MPALNQLNLALNPSPVGQTRVYPVTYLSIRRRLPKTPAHLGFWGHQETRLQPTDLSDPAYFHKVVDCQWACPAHTPVPEYIRLIGQGRYSDAYMINWVSNVFPGVLGRTCDRPCEPACRRGRVEENNDPIGGPVTKSEPVAICRLKRVAADMKDDVKGRMPALAPPNGRRIACVGAGPSALTVARDLAPLGYEVTVFDGDRQAGGFIRSQIPRFRLPGQLAWAHRPPWLRQARGTRVGNASGCGREFQCRAVVAA